jgi:drug/metabolite transporter (DMT)-like permease
VLLTLVWGLNWPVMKLGVSGTPSAPQPYPPLTFRALSMLGGPALLAAALVCCGAAGLPRAADGPNCCAGATNMIVWHLVMIVALQALSSGRAAILGYTMPVFSALWGRGCSATASRAAVAGRGRRRARRGAAAGARVRPPGRRPLAAGAVLVAACVWAYGTHRLRRSTMPVPTLAIGVLDDGDHRRVMSALAPGVRERRWQPPSRHGQGPIAYNAVGVFAFAQVAWLVPGAQPAAGGQHAQRDDDPGAGHVSAARCGWAKPLHWQDYAAVALMVLAIASVVMPPRAASAGVGTG